MKNKSTTIKRFILLAITAIAAIACYPIEPEIIPGSEQKPIVYDPGFELELETPENKIIYPHESAAPIELIYKIKKSRELQTLSLEIESAEGIETSYTLKDNYTGGVITIKGSQKLEDEHPLIKVTAKSEKGERKDSITLKKAYLKAEKSVVSFSYTGGKQQITVYTNCGEKIIHDHPVIEPLGGFLYIENSEYSYSMEEKCFIDKLTLTLEADQNYDGSRQAKIKCGVPSGYLQTEITFFQEPMPGAENYSRQTDSLALLQIYEALNLKDNIYWEKNKFEEFVRKGRDRIVTDWCKGDPIDKWGGVWANENGRVYKLNLCFEYEGDYNIDNSKIGRGEIDLSKLSCVSQLNRLQELEIHGWHGYTFIGPVPESWAELHELKKLWIGNSIINGGRLDKEPLCSMYSKLECLDMQGGSIFSDPIPEWLSERIDIDGHKCEPKDFGFSGHMPSQMVKAIAEQNNEVSNSSIIWDTDKSITIDGYEVRCGSDGMLETALWIGGVYAERLIEWGPAGEEWIKGYYVMVPFFNTHVVFKPIDWAIIKQYFKYDGFALWIEDEIPAGVSIRNTEYGDKYYWNSDEDLINYIESHGYGNIHDNPAKDDPTVISYFSW